MYYGFNGENWFDAQDEISKQLVIDSIPEGKTFTLRFRADKPDFNVFDINKLIDLHESFEAAGKHLAVIYCANVQTDSIVQFSYIQNLVSAGVDIIAVEFGNEEYAASQSNFNFDVYQGWFEPLKDLVETMFPSMKFLVFLAPRPKESGVLGGRKDHSNFNVKAIEYINLNNNCFPTVHIYFNSRECPVRNTPLTPRVYDETAGVDTELETFYTTLMNQAFANLSLWDKTLDYISTNTGKPIFITEFGFDNYGDVKNTLALGKVSWTLWNKYGRDIRIFALLQHNGLSKAGPGMIFPRHPKYDFPGEGANLPRVDYYVYKMFRTLDELPIYDGTTVIDTPTKVAVIADGGSVINVDTDKVILSSVEGAFIGGKYIYTTAGATEWMANGTKPSYNLKINELADLNHFVESMIITTDVVLDINDYPVAVITAPETTTVNTVVRFDGSQSYDTDGTIVNYKWFNAAGDLIISATDAAYIETSFPTEGSSVIYLEVTDSKGATGATHASITVTAAPKPCPWYCTLFPWLKKCNCAKTKIS